MEQKKTQIAMQDPEKCPCRKANCPRHAKCSECMENHHSKGGKPACER